MEEILEFSSFHIKEETNLEESLELLTSLISSTHSTQCFPLKWQLIRAKLEELRSSLHHATIGHHSDLSPIVQSLVSTLDEIQLLAVHSSNESYNGGRLLLISNLNKVISMLDFHIKELSETFSPGVVLLSHSHAIVPAKPAVGAKLDYIKFYIRDIFSRLTIASLDVKAQTLATLRELLSEDERYVQILTQEIDDGIGILVNLLENEDVGIMEEAVGVVLVIAGFDSYKGYLVKAGSMGPLVHALEKRGTVLGKERVIQVLIKLTENSENVWSFSAHGGVSAIVQNLNCTEDAIVSSSELISSICVISRNLIRVDEIKQFMVDEGAIRVLINLLNMKQIQEICKIQLLGLLGEMSFNDEKNKIKMVEESLIVSLTELVNPNVPFCLKTREVSLKFVELLVPYFAPDAGLVRCIVFYLKFEENPIRESALKIVCQLSKVSDEYKRLISESGALIELVQLVGSKSIQVRQMVVEAISNLVSVNHVRQLFLQDESNLKELMRLFDSNESKSATAKFLLSALMSLSESSYGRMQIIASGYVCNLEKMAEFGESDAKKIMKKLSNSRFQSLFSKIWSL